jgi:hypothetical protein
MGPSKPRLKLRTKETGEVTTGKKKLQISKSEAGDRELGLLGADGEANDVDVKISDDNDCVISAVGRKHASKQSMCAFDRTVRASKKRSSKQ